MESTSRNWQDFDPGIKHQLFENFRRYKTNNSVSKNNNALMISSVEQQILQGISIDNNSILEINKVLLKYLQNNTLYNKFDESYMMNNPYGFFQEGLNLFFKDYNPSDSYTYDEQIYICKINNKIYITPDDAFGYQPYIFELSIFDDIQENVFYKNIMINLFALILKTKMFNYYTDTQVFEQIENDHSFNEKGEIESVFEEEYDHENLIKLMSYVEEYKSGHYRDLMNNVIEFSNKNTIESIKSNLLLFFDEANDNLKEKLQYIINFINKTDWKLIDEFVDFQTFTFDIIDSREMKYEERYNHIIDYNKILYDCNGMLEEYYNQFDESGLNESWYQPYLIPFCFSKDGENIDYGHVLDNLMNLFNSILEIERYIYAQAINKGTE